LQFVHLIRSYNGFDSPEVDCQFFGRNPGDARLVTHHRGNILENLDAPCFPALHQIKKHGIRMRKIITEGFFSMENVVANA